MTLDILLISYIRYIPLHILVPAHPTQLEHHLAQLTSLARLARLARLAPYIGRIFRSSLKPLFQSSKPIILKLKWNRVPCSRLVPGHISSQWTRRALLLAVEDCRWLLSPGSNVRHRPCSQPLNRCRPRHCLDRPNARLAVHRLTIIIERKGTQHPYQHHPRA